MRFLMMVKAGPEYEAGLPPSLQLLAGMAELATEMAQRGHLLACEGLQPTSQGTRIALTRGKLAVTDGPFAETKEVIGGFAIMKAESKDEALGLARRFLDVHQQAGVDSCEVELRPLVDPENCASVGIPAGSSSS
jgi:hypothetical protein